MHPLQGLTFIAYDTLTDLKKRRTYDSSEEFDDSIPSEKAANEKEFFGLFDPVFERNARYTLKWLLCSAKIFIRFSLVQPAPKLGDMKTSYPQSRT